MKAFMYLLFAGFLFAVTPLHATPPFEFRKIKAEDIDLEYYRNKYPDEPAVIIGDIGSYEFKNTSESSIGINLTQTTRILILNEAGLEMGDYSIPFYNDGNISESITKFRAFVYNNDGRRIKRTRVRIRDGYLYEAGDNWYILNYALPDVKVGSVIDIQYEKLSDFVFEMKNWDFQGLIPVEYSELNVTIPSMFNHIFRFRGFFTPEQDEVSTKTTRFSFRVPMEVNPGVIRLSQPVRIKDESHYYRFVARDIEPFKVEPYTDNLENYLGRMYFEIAEMNYPDVDEENITEAWAEVNRNILRYPNFGGYFLLSKLATKDLASTADSLSLDFKEKIEWALKTINEKVSWNGVSEFRARTAPAWVLERGSGNTAEINLLLIALLSNMEIEVFPVLLSTVDNGSIILSAPNTSQWNYVIALVKTPEGDDILLDGSVPHPAFDYLPDRAVNDKGLLLHDSIAQWICLEQNIHQTDKKLYDLTLDENGDLSGSMEVKVYGFGKYSLLQYMDFIGEDTFWEVYSEGIGAQFTNASIERNNDNDYPFTIKADIHLPGYAQIIGNEVLLPALLFETLEENPFKEEKRLYPVFYDSKLESYSYFKISIPDHFSISHIPENKSESWNSFCHEYIYKITENEINIETRDIRGERKVEPAHYSEFRNYVDQQVRNNNDNFIFLIGSEL
jgi:hypothetical protein